MNSISQLLNVYGVSYVRQTNTCGRTASAELSAFGVEMAIVKLKSPHVSVSGNGESPQQSLFLGIFAQLFRGIRTPVCWRMCTLINVLGDLHTSQCSGQSPHQSVFRGISTPVSVPENLHTSQCFGESPYQCLVESPHQSVLWTIPTPVSVPGNLHIRL